MMDNSETNDPSAIARRQFVAFNEIGDAIAITGDDRRRLLAMSRREWSEWEAFLKRGGAAPSVPAMPSVLIRLANASYRLTVRTDRKVAGRGRAPLH
jgi:hypothetical protein